MKVSLGNMCSFFCQFYYRLVNTARFNEEKSYCMSVLILLVMFLKGWGIGGGAEGVGGVCGQHCMVIGSV